MSSADATPPARSAERLARGSAEDAVDDEPVDLLLHDDRGAAHPVRPGDRSRAGLVGGGGAADHLAEVHHQHWMEEVHVAAAIRASRRVRKPGHDDVARVGRDPRIRREMGVERREDLALHRRVLDDGLDRPRRTGCRRREVVDGRDPAGGRVSRLRFELALVDTALEPFQVRRHGVLELPRVDVDEGHVNPVERRLLSDLGAHGAGADDEQLPLGALCGRRFGHALRTRRASGRAGAWCTRSAPATPWCSGRSSGSRPSASAARA